VWAFSDLEFAGQLSCRRAFHTYPDVMVMALGLYLENLTNKENYLHEWVGGGFLDGLFEECMHAVVFYVAWRGV
jgi:hypothetical protein